MDEIVVWFKNYFVLMLLLLLFSHLTPREHYRKYVQFFVGLWLLILLLEPVYQWRKSGKRIDYINRKEIESELEKIKKWEGEGADVFELFYMDQEKKEGAKAGE